MVISIQKDTWSLSVCVSECGARLESGHFGNISLLSSPLFQLKEEDRDGIIHESDSAAGWETVRHEHSENMLKLWFAKADLTVILTGEIDARGISWTTDILNRSEDFSVTEVTYPIPTVKGEPLHLFTPEFSGRAITDTEKHPYELHRRYLGHRTSMQYFAWWNEAGGLYLGVHDPDASMKLFDVTAKNAEGHLQIIYPAVGSGEPANSFTLGGTMRWEFFLGDWYDATLIYADFVHKNATWLPTKGRPDTPQRYKDIPFWICDYIPNSEKQGDARPRVLAAVSERYGKDYWVDAAIQLKERLGTPVAYHVYNWHEIPFNINYPHFMPAKEIVREGFQKLKEAGVYVFPYINGVSWEMNDADEGFEENFSNTGIHGATIVDGAPFFETYPQQKATGLDTRLAPICPTFTRWHEIIEDVTREVEKTLPVDGIYFDQVACFSPLPCRHPEHTHRPGGGTYWTEGYQQMMAKINAERPAEAFYFSESNGEAYVGSFDGLLTWKWCVGDDVPAFPILYAGYVQMVGRYTDGARRDDDDFFRYHLAEALLFGQQPGWINAYVIYNEKRMCFLEKIVHTRYQYTRLFNEGRPLRPPMVESDLPPVTSSKITMRQVVAGIWQRDDRSKTVLFVVNISEKTAHATLRLRPQEYGVSCPEVLELTLDPMSVQTFEY